MGRNKQDPLSYNNEDNDYIRTLEELQNLKLGNLSKTNLEDRTTNFTMENEIYVPSRSGSIDRDYVDSHKTNILESYGIPSKKAISKGYYSKHETPIDEQKVILRRQESNEDSDAEPRIPFDYLIKNIFLQQRSVRCCGGIVFLYDEGSGSYDEQTEASLHVAIRKSLTPEMDMKLSKHKIIDVVHRIVSSPELQIQHEDFDSHTHLINFRNCVFDTISRKCYPHSPNYLFTSFIDADYVHYHASYNYYKGHLSESGTYFNRFLDDSTNGDAMKKKALQQLTGYIISNEWRAKKFFVLVGLPHTGKSVWLSLWRSLIGERHTTAMSLKQLGETRFMTAELFRSKLNITAEMDENGTIKGTDVIKTITGNDLITAEKKGKDPFQFRGKTKLVAACNYMPPLNKLDGTTAFTDRIQFLIFNNTIPEEKRDKSLMDKLVAEKSFIIDWALEGLQELRERSWIFPECEDARIFKRRYINESNNVTEFVRDRCQINLDDDNYKVHRKQIYPAYKHFCNENGFKAISKQEFFVEILKLNVKPGKLRINGSTPLQGFWGIRLKTQEELNKLKEEYPDLTSTLATHG